MSKIQNEKMYTENPKIINFYKEHPNIDFEKSNLLLVDFLDRLFNNVTDSLDSNINSQILSYLQSSKQEFYDLKSSIETMSNTLSTASLQTVQNINTQLGQIKMDYIEEVKTMITNSNITTSDKISTLIDKSNAQLLDRTTIVLNETIPKTQDSLQNRIRESIEHQLKELSLKSDIQA